MQRFLTTSSILGFYDFVPVFHTANTLKFLYVIAGTFTANISMKLDKNPWK